jgi:CopG family transcriptional regulator/antitoxin EndoAI
MSKRINIILPEKTVAVLDRVTTKGNRSRFIDRAVLHYIENRGKQSLREQLKAGYQANAERDLATAAEWFPLEEEAWETFGKAARKPARKMVQRSKRA